MLFLASLRVVRVVLVSEASQTSTVLDSSPPAKNAYPPAVTASGCLAALRMLTVVLVREAS